MRELSEPAGPRHLLDNFAAVVDEARDVGLDVVVGFNDKTCNREYVVKRASDGIPLCILRSGSMTALAAFVAGYAEAKAEPVAGGVPTVVVTRGGTVHGAYGKQGESIVLVDFDEDEPVSVLNVEDIQIDNRLKAVVSAYFEKRRSTGARD